MSEETTLVFLTEPKRFMDLVANEDPQERLAGLKNFDDVVLCEIIRYGCYNREEMIGPLGTLYRDLVMKMPEDRRLEIFRHIKNFIENVSFVSVNAFLPFIAEDNSRGIVSTAVIDYVSLGPLTNDDPMSRVKDIIGMIESGMLENEGAAFGALLHIGDKRVCDLLIPLRDSLDYDAMNIAVKCSTGFIHSATADFYLDWLEGMEGSDQDGAFGVVASGLGLLKKKSRFEQVSTGHRPFPARSATPEQWNASQNPISLAEYVQRISRRMYALERAEPPPRIMPHVLTEWGLKPLTDPAETAVLAPVGWTVGTRPQHVDRFEEIRRELARDAFSESMPASQAFCWIAGLLNNQFAVMQKAGLFDAEGERALRMPFSLGYLFGVAAWYSDALGVPRPSAEANQLVVLSHQEALGPLSDEQVAGLSSAASRAPEFAEGMEAAASDAEAWRSGRAPGAFGLAQFVAKAKRPVPV